MYVFRSGSEKENLFSVKPAVYVAEAQTPEEARSIHRRLWNPGQTPFLISELLEILSCIYGIEREIDACYVTEFSLILILLQYTDVTVFLRDEHAKLPSLHNTHIFQCDFFDETSPVWIRQMKFDLIIGNPPWIAADDVEESLAVKWIHTHNTLRPVDNKSVAEAFSWRVLDLLAPDGYVGLILPASLLYNLGAWAYRQAFFEQCEVRRMTNFSNLRNELFEGRAIAPAITMIYHLADDQQEKVQIEHYGPFALNQITQSSGKLWTITINEYEYQAVSPYEAAVGGIATWKFALWGTHRDRRAVARLRKLFPQTLAQLCHGRVGWHLYEGPQLRNGAKAPQEKLKYIPELAGKKRLNTQALNRSGYLFSIPESALEDLPLEECYIRERGGEKGFLVSEPPHIVMNAGWRYSIYSDRYFIVRPRQIGLAVPRHDAELLRALAVFLSCSLIDYYLFFQVPQGGIERDVITLDTARSIPVPTFTPGQIEQLAAFLSDLIAIELEHGAEHARAYLNQQVASILHVPESIFVQAYEFMQIRSRLVGGGTREARAIVQRYPDKDALQAYAVQLAHDLDGFLDSGSLRHQVSVELLSSLRQTRHSPPLSKMHLRKVSIC